MQTLQFTRALKRIAAELKAAQLVSFLDRFLKRSVVVHAISEDDKNLFSGLLFESREGFAELTKDKDAETILLALNIEKIYASPRLGKLLSTFFAQSNAQGIWNSHENFADFFSFVTSLRSLLDLEAACSQILEVARVGEAAPGTEIVEVELADYDGTGIDASRVDQFFSTLNELHSNIARALGIGNADVKILYLDSGSNFLIGIQTVESIAQTLRLLFKEFWEKVKYRRFEEFDRKVESLSKGLAFTAVLDEQIKNNVIDEETGRNLQYRVLSEMTTLIGIGATLAQTPALETVDHKKLLVDKKGVKLLGTGEPPGPTKG